MTPRTAEQNLALREATREKLLDAALRIFGKLGYESASIRLIAEEAGLAQGLMYSHFKGKEDLLKALFGRSMDQVRQSFAAAAAADDKRPPLEKLVRSGLSLVGKNMDFWKLSYGMRMQAGVVKALGKDLDAWTMEILSVLQMHFRAAGSKDPLIDAALFFAAFDGLCQHYVLDPKRYPLAQVADALLSRFAQPVAKTATRAASKAAKGRSHGKASRD